MSRMMCFVLSLCNIDQFEKFDANEQFCFRFMAVVYPLRPQLQTRDAKKVIVVIWLFALALVSPYMAVLDLHNKECVETFHKKGLQAGAYTISIFLLQYVVPLSVIGLSYIR